MRSCQLENFVPFLFRNETESQFRHRMTGDDCLCPLPLISSADSIDLGCWSSPDALERIVTTLAKKFGDACFLEDQFVAIDWKFAPRFALPFFQRLHPVIESRDCHAAFTIVKCGEQLRQRGDWILDSASKNAGMQIHLRPSNLDLEGGHSTQTIAECWYASLNHSSIGDHGHVAFERIAIFLQKNAQVCAADFLFALNHQMQIHRQVAILFDRFLNAENV